MRIVSTFLATLVALFVSPPAQGRVVAYGAGEIAGVLVNAVSIDLTDPATQVEIGLAHGAPIANNARASYGDEPFPALVARARAAVVINGTFFSKDVQKRMMGNVVIAGRYAKYSQWENAGTTFGLRGGNVPMMHTIRAEGPLDQSQFWTGLTCGPRLVKDGLPWLHPALEGFRDPHVYAPAPRSALGFTRDGKTLFLVSFGAPISLERAATVMYTMGAYQAMNLDGGSSRALAIKGRVVVPAGRPLTNVLVIYDADHPAPPTLRNAFLRSSSVYRPTYGQPSNPTPSGR